MHSPEIDDEPENSPPEVWGILVAFRGIRGCTKQAYGRTIDKRRCIDMIYTVNEHWERSFFDCRGEYDTSYFTER